MPTPRPGNTAEAREAAEASIGRSHQKRATRHPGRSLLWPRRLAQHVEFCQPRYQTHLKFLDASRYRRRLASRMNYIAVRPRRRLR